MQQEFLGDSNWGCCNCMVSDLNLYIQLYFCCNFTNLSLTLTYLVSLEKIKS